MKSGIKGQLSMEMLMILVLSVSVLIVMLPALNKLHDLSNIYILTFKGKDILNNLESNLNLIDNGSNIIIKTTKSRNLVLSCTNESLDIKIFYKDYYKELKREINIDCYGDANLSNGKYLLSMQNNIVNISKE